MLAKRDNPTYILCEQYVFCILAIFVFLGGGWFWGFFLREMYMSATLFGKCFYLNVFQAHLRTYIHAFMPL